MTIGQFDANLRRFYVEARKKKDGQKKDGESYSKKSLLGFRHGVERFLNKPPHNRNLKLSSDPRFKRSNNMLDAQLVQLKRSGKENSQHKPPGIESEDFVKLKASGALSPSTTYCPFYEMYGSTWYCFSAEEVEKAKEN